MATDYAKKKNDELAALCKERGLPHTGKKADLVKRLEEHDASSAAPAAKPAVEDEIDWDDEPATETAKAATTESAATAIAAGGTGQPPNPQAVPNQQVAEDPSKADDLTVAAAPTVEGENTKENVIEQAQKEKTPEDFSIGMAEVTLDEEIAKRKKRAEKFGLDPKEDETLKMLERAKRFGGDDLPGFLNKALPERQAREKKRGRGEKEDGGVRKRSKPRPGMGGRQESGRGKANGNKDASRGGTPSWMSEIDKEAAAKRKAKFAGTD